MQLTPPSPLRQVACCLCRRCSPYVVLAIRAVNLSHLLATKTSSSYREETRRMGGPIADGGVPPLKDFARKSFHSGDASQNPLPYLTLPPLSDFRQSCYFRRHDKPTICRLEWDVNEIVTLSECVSISFIFFAPLHYYTDSPFIFYTPNANDNFLKL